MPTVPVTIRVRQSIVDSIDVAVASKFFTSRPEWILQAMRTLYSFTSYVMYHYSEDSGNDVLQKDLHDVAYGMAKYCNSFEESTGNWIQIMIRVPSDFKQEIERICGPGLIFPSFRDFIKCAIVDGVSNPNHGIVLSDEILGKVREELSRHSMPEHERA